MPIRLTILPARATCVTTSGSFPRNRVNPHINGNTMKHLHYTRLLSHRSPDGFVQERFSFGREEEGRAGLEGFR